MTKRILVILKKWLEHYFHDFDGDLLKEFQEVVFSKSLLNSKFITTCPHESDVILLRKVLEVVEKKVKKIYSQPFNPKLQAKRGDI